MWMQHPQFESKLAEWWNIDVDGTALFRVVSKLRNVKKEVELWNKKCFGNIFERKESIKDDIQTIQDKIQKEGYSPDLVREENEKLVQYHDIVTKEEIYWRQRTRLIWLNQGDKSTRFFHLSTLKHRAKNRISYLKKGDLKITEENDISGEMVSFFSSLMTADPNIDPAHQAEILKVIPPLIIEEQNKLLGCIPKEEEILNAICSLGGDKSPRIDGFPMFFFQKNWKLVGREVCDAVKEFLGAKRMLKEINSTFLCLIPKKIGADSPDQFRSISLCNSFYTIISKILNQRLLLVLPSLIADQQNGFIPGRKILNFFIVVHENIHFLSCSNNYGSIMKVDIAKAYDRVE